MRNTSRRPAAAGARPRGSSAIGSAHRAAPYSEIAKSKARQDMGALGVAEEEREVEAVFGLQATGRLELFRTVVDAHRTRASPGQPRRHVGGPAAELDRVEAR